MLKCGSPVTWDRLSISLMNCCTQRAWFFTIQVGQARRKQQELRKGEYLSALTQVRSPTNLYQGIRYLQGSISIQNLCARSSETLRRGGARQPLGCLQLSSLHSFRVLSRRQTHHSNLPSFNRPAIYSSSSYYSPLVLHGYIVTLSLLSSFLIIKITNHYRAGGVAQCLA